MNWIIPVSIFAAMLIANIILFKKALQHLTEEGKRDKGWVYFWGFRLTRSEREKYFDAEGVLYFYKSRIVAIIGIIVLLIASCSIFK